jgi:P-type E1-E2 ATPase
MLEYIFTDKTGTLTRNEMVMKELTIGKKSYLTTNTSDEYKLQRIFRNELIMLDRATTINL